MAVCCFPSALGGVISQIDTVGANSFVADCDRMADTYGERFKVPQQLREMAAKGTRYYQSKLLQTSA
jgi:3-hydroxyacyl-CoA dehydrogenase/enoyl-CoA hydratase/3-hydroxybutyryl-CoA epimerase